MFLSPGITIFLGAIVTLADGEVILSPTGDAMTLNSDLIHLPFGSEDKALEGSESNTSLQLNEEKPHFHRHTKVEEEKAVHALVEPCPLGEFPCEESPQLCGKLLHFYRHSLQLTTPGSA